MKGKLLRKIIASVSAVSMLAPMVFAVPASAESYNDQTVEVSKFDKGGSYDAASGFETLSIGSSKTWSKLDLTPYTQHGTEKTMKVTISYTDIVSSNGRSAIGFYDKDLAQYKTDGWQDTIGSAVVYGMCSSGPDKRVFVSGVGANKNGKFDLDTEQQVNLVIDFQNNKISGSVGAHTIAETDITNGIDSIDVMGVYSWSATTYKIKDMKISVETSSDTYYDVTFDVEGKTTKESVKAGEKVASDKIPVPEKAGYTFKGWYKDGDESTLISSDTIANTAVNASASYKAVFEVDTTYVHKIAKVEIVTTKTDAIIPKTEMGESDDYTYTAKVTSINGEEIPADKCTFKWSIVGNEADDNYTHLTQSQDNPETATLNVLAGVSNYYGYIQVEASYNPENSDNDEDNSTGTAKAPYAILAEQITSNIIPAAGYPEDMSKYPDSLVGYSATSDGETTRDLVLNNWSIYGSNAGRDLVLVKDEATGKKSLEFRSTGGSRGGSGSSTIGNYQWPAQSKQYTIDTTIKLPTGAGLGIWNKTPNNSGAESQCVVRMTAEGITVGGGSAITGTSDASKYYRIVMACDPTNKKSYAAVYGEDGNLIGTSDIAVSSATAAMKYMCLDGSWPINIRSMKAYNNAPATMTINGDDSVKVPESGTQTATYTETCLDKDGIRILTDPVWSLDEDYGDAVSIDAATGVLTITPEASGTIIIKATVGSVVAEKEVTLSTSGNVVSMKGASSLTIPFTGEPAATATYSAQTLDSSAQPVEGDTITYSFLNKDNEPLAQLPNGISFDNATGVLTVEAGANPTIIYLKATNTEGLTNKIRINIHGMSFGFGTGEPAEGYTQVTSATQYTDKLGFGFKDVSSLTDAETNVAGSAEYCFKVKVPNGNYTVDVTTTSASMKSEVVEGIDAATGITKSGARFDVAVCDGILDLTFSAGSNVSSVAIAQKAKGVKPAKPSIYAIGDSTTKNGNGANSWAEVAGQYLNTDVFSTFANHGKAGDDSVVYYNSGRVENVLLSVQEGDYVTINMGINTKTAGEPASYATLIKNYYISGVLQRGAIPVILTHTPQGPVGNYASSNYKDGVFHTNRTGQHNDELRAFAKEMDLNLIDVSAWADEYFNALTDEDVANPDMYGDEQGFGKENPPTNKLQLVQSWFKDHNHYDRPFSDEVAKYILGELEKIAKSDIPIPPPATTHKVTFNGNGATVKVNDEIVTEVTVNDGESLSFTVTPAPGNEIVSVKAGETALNAVDGVYTLTDVKADTEITVECRPTVQPESWIKYDATYENGILQSVTVTKDATPQVEDNTDTHKIFYWNGNMKPWTAE